MFRVGTTNSISGWMAVLYEITDENYEVIYTGLGRYHSQEHAEAEMLEIAELEGVPHEPLKHTLVNENQQTTTNQNNIMAEHEPMTIKRIKADKEDADNVKCIKGTITKLFDAKKGQGDSGDWEYQNGEFKDENGDSIKICFSKCSQPKGARGRPVVITSIKSEQHGWLGIKVEDKSYEKDGEPVKERTLKITPSAEIVFKGEAPSETGSGGGGGGGKPSSNTGGGGGGQSRPAQNLTLHPQVVLEDMIFLHSKVTDLVTQLYGGEGGKPPEFIQATVGTIFIEAAKCGLTHDFKARIAKPIPKTYPPAPNDPKDWDACIIPKGEYEGKTLKDLPDDKLKELFAAVKESSTAFAKCVREAAAVRKVFKEEPKATDPDLDPPEDDIPF